ncbi:MAG TPA: carboxymethylenebutenolidase [Rhodocyclaceae bacterium]|nr:MAG: carboxymethylenebutenolidase [Betaproteobacteria bacterium CG2_30_68_42]HCX33143.1 carboxymethylenebutenolidase [Rhodocyclaceae bacterium]
MTLPAPEDEFNSLLPENRYSRRGFIATALAGGFTLAAGPVMAQTAIHTDAAGLRQGEVGVKAADGEVPAYRAMPATGRDFPVVLVVEEIFGVHEYIKDICRRLAKLGYLAIAPELYARYGDASKLTGVKEALALANQASDELVMSDLDACVAWAQTEGGDTARLAITGFCRGGHTVWMYCAHQPKLRAGVAWYGPLAGPVNARTPKHPLDVAGELKAGVLGLYGGKDQGISVEQIERMRAAIAKAGGRSQIHIYPDAPHAFHADYRPSYRKEAAEDGWKRMLEWFRQHGV